MVGSAAIKHITTVSPDIRIAATRVRFPGQIKGTLAAKRKLLASLHNTELDQIVARAHLLLDRHVPRYDVGKFVENYRREYGLPKKAEIIYDFIEPIAVTIGNKTSIPAIYLPFIINGEYYAVRRILKNVKEHLGSLILPGREVLLVKDDGEYVCEYISGQDYEDFRQFMVTINFNGEAKTSFDKRHGPTIVTLCPNFQEQTVERFGTGKRIVVVGGGSGEVELAIRERGNEIVIVDLSPAMVEAARKNGLEAIEGNAHELTKLVSGQFDAAFFPESLGYQWESLSLRQACQVLVPGGKLHLITYPPARKAMGYRRFKLAALQEAVIKAGFIIDRAESMLVTAKDIKISEEPAKTELDHDNIQVITARKAA